MNLEEKYDYYKKLYPKNIIIFENYLELSFCDDYLILRYIFNEIRKKESDRHYNILNYLVSLGLGCTVVSDKEHYEYLLNVEKIDLNGYVFKEVEIFEPLNEEVYDLYLKLAKLCKSSNNALRVDKYLKTPKNSYIPLTNCFYEGSIE